MHSHTYFIGVYLELSNIYDGTFCEYSLQVKMLLFRKLLQSNTRAGYHEGLELIDQRMGRLFLCAVLS